MAACLEQVTTPGNIEAARYVHEEALKLAALAADMRPDLDVEVGCLFNTNT